jgi:hypothetical protein
MLSKAVQGARHTSQRISWVDGDGDAHDLSGSVITGRKVSVITGIETDLDGTLTIVSGINGVFDWAYGVNDVAEAGAFRVQFSATYGPEMLDRTMQANWEVEPAI